MTQKECVVDTIVLRSANAPFVTAPRGSRRIVRRVELLRRIQRGEIIVLISSRLQVEYGAQIKEPRNEFIRAFFELLVSGDMKRVRTNWCTPWTGSHRARTKKCRFPRHDLHLLRTAASDSHTWIATEEKRLLDTDACIYRNFNVNIVLPENI